SGKGSSANRLRECRASREIVFVDDTKQGEVVMNTQSAEQVRRRYWDIDEFAEFLGVSRHWVYKRTQSNGPETIPHSKFGKFLRFDPQSAELQEWLEKHRN